MPVIMWRTSSYPSKCSWPLPHMWAPVVSRTTSRASSGATCAVADASPVRSALTYNSAARTRWSISLSPPPHPIVTHDIETDMRQDEQDFQDVILFLSVLFILSNVSLFHQPRGSFVDCKTH